MTNFFLADNFNLDYSLLGGQSFAWDKLEDGSFVGAMQERCIWLKPEKNKIWWQTYPKKDEGEQVKQYLRLDVDYNRIIKTISRDSIVKESIAHYQDLRILGQDFQQCFLSYLVSSCNTINSIRARIRLMNRKFGKQIKINGMTCYSFPKTEVIAEAPLDELLQCKLGFHAKHMKAAATRMQKEDLGNKIPNLEHEAARALLKTFQGVGDKIADCVLLYSLKCDSIFPQDVWGRRVLVDWYKLDPSLEYDEFRAWIIQNFGGYGGWAGQFLFEKIRGFNLK